MKRNRRLIVPADKSLVNTINVLAEQVAWLRARLSELSPEPLEGEDSFPRLHKSPSLPSLRSTDELVVERPVVKVEPIPEPIPEPIQWPEPEPKPVVPEEEVIP